MSTRLASTVLAAALAVVTLAAPGVASAPQPGTATPAPDSTIDSAEDLVRVLAHLDAADTEPASGIRADRSREAAAGVSTSAPVLRRLAGENRYETAVRISQDSYPDPSEDFGGTVYIANGANFPDALAVGPVAATHDSPTLLVPPTEGLPAVVRDEITRLRPERAVVVGGIDNVTAKTEADIRALIDNPLLPTIRLAGINRYRTAAWLAMIMEYNDEDGVFVHPETVIVSSGLTFADALSGGAAGGWEYAPLLLTAPHRLDPAVEDLLTPIPPRDDMFPPYREYSRVRILGSTSTVSLAVENRIRQILPNAEVIRYSGRDRFETAALLNDDVFEFAGAEATLTNGLRFPDALAGAPRVTHTWGPIVPVRPECLDRFGLASLATFEPSVITALGGVDAVSDAALGGAACR